MPAVTPRSPAPSPYRAVRGNAGHRTAAFALSASILAALLAASSAPTPLCSSYQTAWGPVRADHHRGLQHLLPGAALALLRRRRPAHRRSPGGTRRGTPQPRGSPRRPRRPSVTDRTTERPSRDRGKRTDMSTPPATRPTTQPATRPPTIPAWTVGDVTVHRIDETLLPPATGPWLLPDATPAVVAGQDWLRPHFADEEGILHLDSHSFAFTVDGLRVLVDTGIGNGKERANPATCRSQRTRLDSPSKQVSCRGHPRRHPPGTFRPGILSGPRCGRGAGPPDRVAPPRKSRAPHPSCSLPSRGAPRTPPLVPVSEDPRQPPVGRGPRTELGRPREDPRRQLRRRVR